MSAPRGGSGATADATLVCFALAEEARPFRKRRPRRGNVEILLLGVGPRNAERVFRARLAGRPRPTRVLTCGYAGALAPGLRVGDLVFASESDAGIAARLAASGACEVRFHCCERVAVTAAEKRALRETTGAHAVEMESGVVHALCREAGIPCTTLRAISDVAGEDLPLDFNRFTRPDGGVDLPRVLLAIARSPNLVPRLLRLRRQCRAAAERLAEILETVLTSV